MPGGPPSPSSAGRSRSGCRPACLIVVAIVCSVVTLLVAGGVGVTAWLLSGPRGSAAGSSNEGPVSGGDLIWHADLPTAPTPSFAPSLWVTAAAVVFVGDGRITALSPASGRTLWQEPIPDPGGGPGVLCGASSATAENLGIVAYGQGRSCRGLAAIDLSSGRVAWATPFPEGLEPDADPSGWPAPEIVGSTVITTGVDSLFVTDLANGDSAIRCQGQLYPYKDLLVDPSGQSAVLAAYGIYHGQVQYNGSGDVQIWRIGPDGSARHAFTIPQASIPQGSAHGQITDIELLSTDPLVATSGLLAKGGEGGISTQQQIFTISPEGGVTALSLATPYGLLDVGDGDALDSGPIVFGHAANSDAAGNVSGVADIAYSSGQGNVLWAHRVPLDERSRPIGVRNGDVVFAGVDDADVGARLTITDLNEKTGAVDHQDSNYPSGFAFRALDDGPDQFSTFDVAGGMIYGASIVPGGTSKRLDVEVYALR